MLLFDRLHRTIAHARRNDELFVLLIIDLDRFKEVNERWGQDAGDRVLRIVAERFAAALRSTDSLARMGGDVFAAIAEGLMFGDDVEPVVQKLRGALASPISLAGEALHLGATIGMALFPASGEDAEALYRAAETALRQAKEKHRGGLVIFEPGIGAGG
ncbi:MAG: Diguanylate cyclase DosC [Betaproteobacteria bacterium ADurb.Bin341]|nr:MAG: Diguanylate cyclase DosC [Betaproteobacteria bacterium ADurb.Bin341]